MKILPPFGGGIFSLFAVFVGLDFRAVLAGVGVDRLLHRAVLAVVADDQLAAFGRVRNREGRTVLPEPRQLAVFPDIPDACALQQGGVVFHIALVPAPAVFALALECAAFGRLGRCGRVREPCVSGVVVGQAVGIVRARPDRLAAAAGQDVGHIQDHKRADRCDADAVDPFSIHEMLLL